MEYILAIDQGTHASRALVFDPQGHVIAHARQEIGIIHKAPDVVEQDAEEILRSVEQVIDQVIKQVDVTVHHAALAVQRSTLVAWDRTSGKPLAPALSWQDRRCADELQDVRQHTARIHHLSGLPVSPHYLAGKIRWLLRHNADVKRARNLGTLVVGPLSSYLLFHLLHEQPIKADHSNAARSLLFDLHTRDWSHELLQIFDIDKAILPDCVPIQHPFGHMKLQDIPLTCVCGDQNAAIHAQGTPASDTALINIGTGAFVLQTQGTQLPRHPSLLAGIAHSTDTGATYLLEGTVNGAGAALSALRSAWPDVVIEESLPDWLDTINDPPLYINGVGGLGSPWWVEHIDSRFTPDTTEPAQLAVAVVESIVFLLQHNLEHLQKDQITRIRVSGGLSLLDGLCQRIADLCKRPVIRQHDPEATARGLAWLSTSTQQAWPQHPETHFTPQDNPALHTRYTAFINEIKRITGKFS